MFPGLKPRDPPGFAPTGCSFRRPRAPRFARKWPSGSVSRKRPRPPHQAAAWTGAAPPSPSPLRLLPTVANGFGLMPPAPRCTSRTTARARSLREVVCAARVARHALLCRATAAARVSFLRYCACCAQAPRPMRSLREPLSGLAFGPSALQRPWVALLLPVPCARTPPPGGERGSVPARARAHRLRTALRQCPDPLSPPGGPGLRPQADYGVHLAALEIARLRHLAPPPGRHLDRGCAPAFPSPRATPCGRKWPSGCARRLPLPSSPRRGVSERQATWGPARAPAGRGTSVAGCPTPGSPEASPSSGAVVAGAGVGKEVQQWGRGLAPLPPW